MEKTLKILKRLDVYVVAMLLLAVFIDVMLQIISRITPGNAIPWTVEMGEILLAAIIWMGLGPGVVDNNHVRFDLLLAKLPHRPKKVFYIIGNILFAVFLLILAYYTITLLQFYLKTNTRTPSLRWNKAIIRAPVFVGCIIGAVRMLIQAWFFAKEKIPLPSGEKEISEAVEAVEAGLRAEGEK
jgi:TRAP-type C4-dicarboxylate transport system permease small subunit